MIDPWSVSLPEPLLGLPVTGNFLPVTFPQDRAFDPSRSPSSPPLGTRPPHHFSYNGSVQ